MIKIDIVVFDIIETLKVIYMKDLIFDNEIVSLLKSDERDFVVSYLNLLNTYEVQNNEN